MKANLLNAKSIATLPQGNYHDGRGLYIRVSQHTKVWMQRLHGATATTRKLGEYPAMSLGQARDASRDMRDNFAATGKVKGATVTIEQFLDQIIADATTLPQSENARRIDLLRSAADQLASLGEAKPTFEALMAERIAAKSLADATAAQWEAELSNHASAIMATAIDQIDLDALKTTLMAIASPVVRKRVWHRLDDVCEYAVTMGHIERNPAAKLEAVIAKPTRYGESNHEALDPSDVPGAIATIQTGKSEVAKAAILFTILTAARSAETTGATWGEIDLGKATWTIPAARMKMGKAHRVPLSKKAMALIADLTPADARHADAPLFPGKFASGYLTQAIRRMGINSTLHGFRASFSTWAREDGVDTELREMCLAHAGDKVVRAYQRSDMLKERRAIMANWERHCMA